MKKSIWKTKDGQEIPVNKLEDSHLTNILKMYFNSAEEGYECGGGFNDIDDYWLELYYGEEAFEMLGLSDELLKEALNRKIITSLDYETAEYQISKIKR